MKKIDIIVKYFYPVAAGIEANIMQTHKYFLEKGWNVTVHTSRDTLTEKNVLKEKDEVEGIKVIRYSYGKFGFFPKIDWQNTDVVSLHNFNIFPHFQIMLYVIWLKLIGKKKFIFSLTPHGGFNPEWRIFNRLAAFIKQIYHYTVGTFLINLSMDVVRAVSEWEHDQMASKRIRKNKIHTIINGAEDEAYMDIDKLASKEIKEKVSSYGKYILQMGRIYMIKNYETTIKALALLPKDINYVIAGPVGSEDYKKELEILIKELSLKKRVIFAGIIRGIDKYYLIKHAETMVHMALWESFCNVVYEALGQGLVPIVSNNTALPYLVKNNVNGFTLRDKDYKGVADKIKYVLENKNSPEIKKMSATNREFGLNNSWKVVSNQLEKIYLLKSRFKKRTIVISNYDEKNNFYYGGGGAMASHEIAKRLSDEYYIKYICGAYRHSRDSFIDGVEYKHIGSKNVGPLLGQIIYSILLPLYVVKENYDIWIENFSPPHSTNFLQLYTNKPVIGLTSLLHAKEFSKKYRFPFVLVERMGITTYKYFIALNSDLAKQIRKNNKDAKIKVIPRGIDTRYFDIKTSEKLYVVYLGRIDFFQKGIDMLVNIWKEVSKTNPKVKLIIIGSGKKEEYSRLRKIINEKKINKSVMLVGRKDGVEKEQLIKNSLLAVSTSRFEGFGNSALEMLAMGKPLVCFDIPGYKWIPKNACIKVPVFNESLFAQRIAELIRSKSKRKILSITSRKHARQYAWSEIVDQYRDYFKELSEL